MKNINNFFQKMMLMIIALAAICLVIQNQIIIQKLTNQPYQNQTPFTTQVSNNSGKNYLLMPVKEDGSVDINIKSTQETMNVNIQSVNGRRADYPLDVWIRNKD
jgi:hypothetical protein